MKSVAILVFSGVQSLDVSGPLDVFAEANRFLLPASQYRMELIGLTRGAVPCSNGMLLVPQRHYAEVDEAPDLLLVAGGPDLPAAREPDEGLAWLRAACARAGRYGAICNGIFLLARAGLPAGAIVTTHWNDAQALAARYPELRVEPDRLYVRDGRLHTSAGVTAGIDLALSLVAQDHGPDVALNVAKRLVVFMQRAGGQSQFSPFLTPFVEETSAVAQVQQHVLGHLADDLGVAALAAVANMSRRNFARVFLRDAGVTPAEFVESARLDAARARLERESAPLKTVAFHCGFRDARHLREVFQRRLGVSPSQYRASFGRPGGAG
ncbi:GlxA family transcriptional regulator [Achromobacter xylosoxidans]|uniref:GlxA family transcriptional regulator n=1 Tax=Alcaligenes xylosoxydans xylosoxydans TaxID=85698 RepID=UPI0022B8B3DF|nr:DJ-1/PfpI family protein [Achromobacter xylosoxidans]MCZ8440733.1 DJ-1/PfpI family protein [Achromobacter xylosoxidans]